jgi:hypothetical protein
MYIIINKIKLLNIELHKFDIHLGKLRETPCIGFSRDSEGSSCKTIKFK